MDTNLRKKDLIARIKKEFPGLSWKKALHNVEGFDHYVLMLDDKYVFRFPRAQKYKKRLMNEVEMMGYLAPRLNIPVPKYEYVAKDKSFAGYKYLSGVKLTGEVFEKITKANRQKLATQLGKFLTVLHTTPEHFAKRFAVANDINTPGANKKLQETVKKSLPSKIPKKHFQMLMDFFEEFKNYQKFPNKTLVHFDLFQNHIFVNQELNSLAGIVDFSDRGYSDPASDFAEIHLYGKDFVAEVYSSYKGPKDKDFLKRAELYYKRVAVIGLAGPFQGGSGSFTWGKEIFRQIFLVVDN